MAFSQNPELDSIRHVAQTSKDTIRFEALHRLGVKFRRINMDSALHFFETARKEAAESGKSSYELQAYNDIGITHGMRGDYPQAMNYLKQLEQRSKEVNDLNWLSSSYSNLGIVYKRIGDYPKSLSYYLKDIELSLELDDQEGLANNYSNLGVLYDLMGLPDKSMSYYTQAAEIYAELNEESGINTINSNIGILLLGEEKYNEAISYFEQSVAHDRATDSRVGLCIALSNLGYSYLKIDENEKAFEALIEALEIAGELGLRQENSSILYNLATLGINEGRLQDALGYAKIMLELVQDIDSYDLKKDAHEIMGKTHEALRDFEKANFHLKQQMLYNDSLLNETKVAELDRQRVVHEVYIKDQELVEQSLNLELLNTQVGSETRMRWGLSAFSVLLIAFLGLLYSRYSSKQKTATALQTKNQVITNQKEEIERMNMELERRMLRAQINPHFIFNSLSAIQHFITDNDKVAALNFLSKFSNLLRQILDNSRSTHVLLDEELKQLKIYIELEALRFDHSFHYEIEVDDNLDTSKYEVPLLLVQPYIENAILHGLMPKDGDKFFSLKFEDQEDHIVCEITDNGIGREKAAQNQSPITRASHGLQVTKQRLDSMSKQSSAQAKVEVEDLIEDGQAVGTRVIVFIPKILNE